MILFTLMQGRVTGGLSVPRRSLGLSVRSVHLEGNIVRRWGKLVLSQLTTSDDQEASSQRETRKSKKKEDVPPPPLPDPSEFPPWAYEPRDYFCFEILHQSTKSQARVGRIHTPHGMIIDTPQAVQAQKDIGADIIIPLDELPPYHIDRSALVESVARSHRWEARSLKEQLKDV